jgi:hypothetical protein
MTTEVIVTNGMEGTADWLPLRVHYKTEAVKAAIVRLPATVHPLTGTYDQNSNPASKGGSDVDSILISERSDPLSFSSSLQSTRLVEDRQLKQSTCQNQNQNSSSSTFHENQKTRSIWQLKKDQILKKFGVSLYASESANLHKSGLNSHLSSAATYDKYALRLQSLEKKSASMTMSKDKAATVSQSYAKSFEVNWVHCFQLINRTQEQ